MEGISIAFEILFNIQAAWWPLPFLQLRTVSDFTFLVPLLCALCILDTPFPHHSKMSPVATLPYFVCCHDCWAPSSPCPNHARVEACFPDISPISAEESGGRFQTVASLFVKWIRSILKVRFLDQRDCHLGICEKCKFSSLTQTHWIRTCEGGAQKSFNHLCRPISKFLPNFESHRMRCSHLSSLPVLTFYESIVLWFIWFKRFLKILSSRLTQGYAQFRQVIEQILRQHIPHIIFYVVSPNIYWNSSASSHKTFKETLIKNNHSEIYHSGVVHHFSE